MEYEVWHMETNERVGTVDVPRHVNHEVGAKAVVKIKGEFELHGRRFNAIEMRVCAFRKEDKSLYYALETNMPMRLLHALEGFVPAIAKPTLANIHTFGTPMQ